MDLGGFIIEGILSLFVGIFGLIGNLMAIIYFGTQKSRLRTFQKLLQMLAIFDLIFIVSIVIVFVIPKFYKDYDYTRFPLGSIFCAQPFMLPLAEVGLTGSIYFTVAISIERYLVICKPFLHLSRSVSSKYYIIPIVCFSIIFNVPHFFEWKMEKTSLTDTFGNTENVVISNNSSPLNNTHESPSLYHIKITKFRKNEDYYQIYWVGLTICFGGILPCMAIITLTSLVVRALVRNQYGRYKNSMSMSAKSDRLNRVKDENSFMVDRDIELSQDDNTFRIIHGVKESRRRKMQIDLAKVTITIVLIFTICHSVKWIPSIYELMVLLKFSLPFT